MTGEETHHDSPFFCLFLNIPTIKREQHLQCTSVLIDDRESLADEWKNSGGIFIHHTKTERTLELLKKQGILSPAIEKPSILVEEEKTDALYDLPPDTP
mmetsp:Transcript_10317/g.15353  ORF Transcript_10317/g.15353 Transcript_10317/m.15353 type:complete len:99 (+) Transcript_10317:1070-1366(+)